MHLELANDTYQHQSYRRSGLLTFGRKLKQRSMSSRCSSQSCSHHIFSAIVGVVRQHTWPSSTMERVSVSFLTVPSVQKYRSRSLRSTNPPENISRYCDWCACRTGFFLMSGDTGSGRQEYVEEICIASRDGAESCRLSAAVSVTALLPSTIDRYKIRNTERVYSSDWVLQDRHELRLCTPRHL